MKFKKTYIFAFWSSLQITFFAFILLFAIAYLTKVNLSFFFYCTFLLSLFVFTFFIIQYRAEKFIFKRIKKIYEEVSLLDVSEFKKESITTDIETLSREVIKFSEEKRVEIASLNTRENFRRAFLGNISHELKTPLFTVQGYILTLLEGAMEDKDIRTKYLNRANKGVERLIDIVKDLDLISKLESNDLALKITSFNAIELIQQVFDMLEMKAKKKHIQLHFDKIYDYPVLVYGDIHKIEQVFINLIENSIKYGKLYGTTLVSLKFNTTKNTYLITIQDNGEGIKKEHLTRVFERFYRVEQSRTRDLGGSGLGLSIVKHIIEAHNQTITLKSEYGKETSFSFNLEKSL